MTTSGGGLSLVGAIVFVTPRNKSCPEGQRALAIRCAGFLQTGAGVILIDVVNDRPGDLHDEIVSVLAVAAPRTHRAPRIYATAYRPLIREDAAKISVWSVALAVGETLPELPLWLRDAEAPIRVDLEATYSEACRRSAIA